MPLQTLLTEAVLAGSLHGVKRFLRGLFLTVASLMAVVVALTAIHAIAATWMLRSEKVALRRLGAPSSWESLLRSSDASLDRAGQTNILLALEAVGSLPRASDKSNLVIEGTAQLPPLDQPLPPEIMAALQNRLNEVTPMVNALCKAADSQPCWFPVPTSISDMDTFSSRMSQVRQTCRYLRMKAIHATELGNTAAATEAIEEGLALAGILNSSPFLIARLVRYSCEGMALKSLEFLLAKTDPTDEQLDRLEASLGAQRLGMGNVLLGEALFVQTAWTTLAQDTLAPSFVTEVLGWNAHWQPMCLKLSAHTGWLTMNEVFYLRYFREAFVFWHEPWDSFCSHHSASVARIPSFYFIAKGNAASLDGARRQELSADGTLACARVAIAIKRFSKATHRLPDTLSELVPMYISELPADPFYGRPLRYSLEGNHGVMTIRRPTEYRPLRFEVYPSKGTNGNHDDSRQDPGAGSASHNSAHNGTKEHSQ